MALVEDMAFGSIEEVLSAGPPSFSVADVDDDDDGGEDKAGVPAFTALASSFACAFMTARKSSSPFAFGSNHCHVTGTFASGGCRSIDSRILSDLAICDRSIHIHQEHS